MQITFIGAGNMSGAIVAGLGTRHDVAVFNRTFAKAEALAARTGCRALPALPARFGPDDIVVLGVKPQQLREVSLELAPRLGGALVVSVAAGVRVAALARWLGTERIVRVMPNTPSMVGHGVAGLFAEAAVGQADRDAATEIMQAVGTVYWLPEETGLDDITCVSGSGPAYVFYFMEAMMAAARENGFGAEDARALVQATFEGALALARDSEDDVSVLRANVTSKGGATERAIAAFEAAGVAAAIREGARACRARSVEMGQQFSQD